MSDMQLKSQRFRREREDTWRRLEALVTKAEQKSAASLTDAEILAAPVLYRSTLSALSVARATSLDQGLTAYLENLSTRAYFFIYGARSTPAERVMAFLGDWPAAVRALWKETLASLAISLLGLGLAMFLVSRDPDWYFAFVDPGLASGRDPTASVETLRQTLYHDDGPQFLSAFAAYLFQHNAQIALVAFALGFAFGVPTIIALMTNGAMLGAMIWLFASKGLGFEFGGWVAIHGVTELFAIVLAGAAGLKIGWASAFPGRLSRLDAIATAGRTAGAVMMGVIIMLLVAGVLEGVGRQLIVNDWARYGVAGATVLLWGLFYYGPRPRRVAL